jgi:hypothetical protein
MKELLNHIGVDAGLAIAGFIGAITGVSGHKKPMLAKVSSIILGVAGAIYLTPLSCEVLGILNEKSKIGVAVIIGYLGIQGIQKIITSKLGVNGNDAID